MTRPFSSFSLCTDLISSARVGFLPAHYKVMYVAFSRIGLNSLAAFALFFFNQDKMVDLEHGPTLNVAQEGRRTALLSFSMM